ncbi:MAG: protein translocase subunit SecDF, partial [Chlamydiia bacterium]|nr:protein translocase subunit SecDF [Chlamydiia bacterium]
MAAHESGFSIPFHQLSHASGFLALKLNRLAAHQSEHLLTLLKNQWHPEHPDLQQLAIVTADQFSSLPVEQKAMSLVVSSSADTTESQTHSIRVMAKGIDRILQSYEEHPEAELAKIFSADFKKLAELLQSHGLFGYRAGGDFIFENNDFASPLIAASREDFVVRGTQKYALLETATLEQRILTENKIDNKIHEDLLKWHDEYRSASLNPNPSAHYEVPNPTRSAFLDNLTLSLRKFFRGDERKILHWGLDLSGGKTVQIELRNPNGDLVTSDAELKQGINELYQRVNKMGVSEVTIRQVGHTIVLDFPGSQSLSAAELIKASTMYFHVVNEKFSPHNPESGEIVNRFLQEVWNEAVVTDKKDLSQLQAIAVKHLDTETGKALVAQGLKLQDPNDHAMSSKLEDDDLCKIAVFRDSKRQGQAHPLLIVFRNYALEGSQLANIRAAYDPAKGNFLSFDITHSESIFQWTSRYCKEQITGTKEEKYSAGSGWRMAVILNDTVINAPTLNEPLHNSAMISGSFSQREVTQLAADLKAGSLTFTPHILSEKNINPELGKTDRAKGITATGVALLLVIGSMVGYYRFGGVVASIAVLFNILILWATLQNLGATLSLAGIA